MRLLGYVLGSLGVLISSSSNDSLISQRASIDQTDSGESTIIEKKISSERAEENVRVKFPETEVERNSVAENPLEFGKTQTNELQQLVKKQPEETQKPLVVAQQSQSSATEPILIQPGPKGMQVELLTTKVTGQILTVTVRYVIGTDNNTATTSYSIEEVSYIEDATAQQYSVLQDQSGQYLAAPKVAERIVFAINSSENAKIVWFKFPAPPPEAQTISINIPEVAPFDGVEIQR